MVWALSNIVSSKELISSFVCFIAELVGLKNNAMLFYVWDENSWRFYLFSNELGLSFIYFLLVWMTLLCFKFLKTFIFTISLILSFNRFLPSDLLCLITFFDLILRSSFDSFDFEREFNLFKLVLESSTGIGSDGI